MRSGIKTLLFSVFLMVLTACQSEAISAPTPEPQTVGVTSMYLDWASASLSDYQDARGEVLFSLDVYPGEAGLSALQDDQISLLIGAIEPDATYFTTPLFKDGIAVIHHPDLEIRALSVEELRAIFSGAEQNWQAFGGENLPIYPVIPLPGDDLRILFQQRVMKTFPFSSLARLLSSPEETLGLIEGQPGAVGLVPISMLEDDTPTFRLEGQSASIRSVENGRYPLSYWVTGVALDEPDGYLRDWIVSLQAEGS
jgi:hypothetical protein